MAQHTSPAAADFWATLVAFRRDMHQHPETGFNEFRTQSQCMEFLIDIAKIPEADIRKAAITGLIVDIAGSGTDRTTQRECQPPGRACVNTVALRADLDALPMTEDNTDLPWRSQNIGVAHMCGHDGHCASLLGVAWLLSLNRSKIPLGKTVRLLFQPAEEGTAPGTAGFDYDRTGGGGATPLIDEGCLEGVDEVYGWHNWPAFPLGDIRVKEGGVMACEHEWTVTLTGRGGHGSQPHATVDPIVAGSAIVSSLQSIVSRNVPSFHNAVVSVCKFHSGEVNNVIPNSAVLGGTIRTVDVDAEKIVTKRFTELVRGVGESFGCDVDIELVNVNPLLSNWRGPTQCVRECAERLKGAEGLLKINEVSEMGLPLLAGEDFARYVQQKPGCYFFLGTSEPFVKKLAALDFVRGIFNGEKRRKVATETAAKPPIARTNCICHAVNYDFNDNVLPRAVTMLLKVVEDRLGLSHDFLFASETELNDFVKPIEELTELTGFWKKQPHYMSCPPCGSKRGP